MGIRVRKGRSKSGPEFELALDKIERGKREFSRIPKEHWGRYGFLQDMTFEEAKAHGQQINAQDKLNQEIEARAKITKRLRREGTVKSAFLPEILVGEFENKLKEDFYGTDDKFLRSKQMSFWRTAQKIISSTKVNVSDYEDRKRVYYKAFIVEEFALSTVEKLINMINKWGKFSAKKQGKFFEVLPMPTGYERSQVDDAYQESGKVSKESSPLYPIDLQTQESKFKPEQYRWLYVSLWFGLRPSEVDILTEENQGSYWELVKQGEYQVLRVYQSKLTRVQKEKRWKQIPLIFEEQITAMDFILNEPLVRPLVKTIKRYLGEKYTTYAGRKGFEALLNRKGIPLEYSSRYLGHTSIERTYKNYQDTSKARIPKDL